MPFYGPFGVFLLRLFSIASHSKSQERLAVLKGRFLASFVSLSQQLPFEDMLYPEGGAPSFEIPEQFSSVKARLESEGEKIDPETLAQAVDDIEAFAKKRMDAHQVEFKDRVLADSARQAAENEAARAEIAALKLAAAQQLQPPSRVAEKGGSF